MENALEFNQNNVYSLPRCFSVYVIIGEHLFQDLGTNDTVGGVTLAWSPMDNKKKDKWLLGAPHTHT